MSDRLEQAWEPFNRLTKGWDAAGRYKRRAEVEAAIRAEYVPKRPLLSFTADGIMMLRWTLPDGVVIEYWPEDGEVTVIDPDAKPREGTFPEMNYRLRALFPEIQDPAP